MKNSDPASGVNLSLKLISQFKSKHCHAPDWAWDYPPSIPLIGNEFKWGESLLIYASAENLSHMNAGDVPKQFTTDDVWDRYRVRYESHGREADTFFPDVGIQPVTNGGLMAAGLFISERMGLPTANDPRRFLEKIAVSNWCKFSIQSTKNQDYLSQPKKLVESLPYVVAELSFLKPEFALLPHKIWEQTEIQKQMRCASPSTRFTPAHQFNATVINTKLGDFDDASQNLRDQMDSHVLSKWMNNLKRLNGRRAWNYLAKLDRLLEG